jgi:hypothetical protein
MSSRTATMPTSLPIKGIAAMVSADVFNLDDPALTTPDGFREAILGPCHGASVTSASVVT